MTVWHRLLFNPSYFIESVLHHTLNLSQRRFQLPSSTVKKRYVCLFPFTHCRSIIWVSDGSVSFSLFEIISIAVVLRIDTSFSRIFDCVDIWHFARVCYITDLQYKLDQSIHHFVERDMQVNIAVPCRPSAGIYAKHLKLSDGSSDRLCVSEDGYKTFCLRNTLV